MKTTPLHLLLAAAVLLLPAFTQAQTVTTGVPGLISYQGRVLNSAGGLVGAGTPVNRTVIFRIWDHPSNTLDANLIYSESQTVTISEGEFSVLIGQGAANSMNTFTYSESAKGPPTVNIANAFNGSARYLGVTVAAAAAIASTDNEITPRQQVVSSAFALRSKFAETLGTSTSTALTVLDNGNAGVGNVNPLARFTVTGATTGTSTNTPQMIITDSADTNERLLFGMDSTGNGTGFIQATKVGTGAQNLLLNPNGGNVGIGMTTAPTSRLDVAGGIKASGAGGFTFNSGDADGGLFSPADGVLTLFTNNSERLRVDGSGNVGIGTAAPGHRLHVVGGNTVVQGSGAGDSIGYSILNSAGVERAVLGMVGGTGQYSADAVLGDAVLRSPGKLLLQSGTGASAICINSSNNVGIGTASPETRLHVNGLIRTGSGTGTSQAPNQSGLVIRRINSNNTAANQIVARCQIGSAAVTLERDGTPGGFLLRFSSTVGAAVAAGSGIDRGGAAVNVYKIYYTGTTGTSQIFTTGQFIGHFRLSFGDPINAAHMTEVVLTRFVDAAGNDTGNWAGTVTSTVDQ